MLARESGHNLVPAPPAGTTAHSWLSTAVGSRVMAGIFPYSASVRKVRFSDLLTDRLRTAPGNPLITFYDDDTGERTELSMTTYANWVAKTANVLLEDFDTEPGDRIRLTTGTHWLTPILLGATWLCGATVSAPGANTGLLIGGPECAADPQAIACSFHPFALAFPEPIRAHDFGSLWPSQPDVFLGNPDDATQVTCQSPSEARVITDLDPATHPGLFLDLLRGGGSMVLVRNPDLTNWAATMATEKATDSIRATDRPD